MATRASMNAYASASVLMSHRLNTLYPNNTANNSTAMFIMDVIRIFEPAGKTPAETSLSLDVSFCSAYSKISRSQEQTNRHWIMIEMSIESCGMSCLTTARSHHDTQGALQQLPHANFTITFTSWSQHGKAITWAYQELPSILHQPPWQVCATPALGRSAPHQSTIVLFAGSCTGTGQLSLWTAAAQQTVSKFSLMLCISGFIHYVSMMNNWLWYNSFFVQGPGSSFCEQLRQHNKQCQTIFLMPCIPGFVQHASMLTQRSCI